MCQGIPLVTRGMIYCPQVSPEDCVRRYVLPFNLKLNTDDIKLNLKSLENINLSSTLAQTKLNLIKLPSLKVNKTLSSIKLNLKKCEE